MAVKIHWIIQKMESWAPLALTEDWDNTGLLIGDANQPVGKILVALDVNDAVLDEAVQGVYDLIITHHPLIYKPLDRLTADTAVGRKIITLIRNDVALYCAHTNLDAAEGGVNDLLFEKLSLTNKTNLMDAAVPGMDETLGRVGYLEKPATLSEWAGFVAGRLALPSVRFAGSADNIIHKIALCAGDATQARFIQAAVQKKCDVFITGDLRYHMTQDALDAGLCLIDGTHYATEALIIEAVVKRLRDEAARDGIFIKIKGTETNGQVFQTQPYMPVE